ncbi:MAG: ABC transporter ATP-binding protein [Anaerolineales bacterium]|nr:ABC transporter ATP-binding protein [Anaerolineales bacterium]
MSNLIDVKDLTKTYGVGDATVHALAGVTTTVTQGEFVAVMGPSGSGKSTLMNIIGCLDRPTSGVYLLEQRDVSRLSKNELAQVRNQKIGFIFQSFNLLARLSALENVMMPMLYNPDSKLNDRERKRRAIEALEAVGLAQRLHHHPNQLSGGQQQRVAIARSLVNRPSLILADEPTGNLDSRSGEEIMDLLHNLHAQGGTVVMVTHEPDIAAHAQRIICVRDGVVISDGREGPSPCLDRQVLSGEGAA